MGIALVRGGALGAAAGGVLTPAFGQATTARSLLTFCVQAGAAGSAAMTCNDGTWTKAVEIYAVNGRAVIWYKKNCGAGEAAPTFTSTGASSMHGVLAEWSGADLVAPLDQTGTSTGVASPATVTASGIDGGPGRLVLCAYSWHDTAASTPSYADSMTGAIALVTDNASGTNHVGVAYSLTLVTGSVADTNQETKTGGALANVNAVIASFAPVPPPGPPLLQTRRAVQRASTW